MGLGSGYFDANVNVSIDINIGERMINMRFAVSAGHGPETPGKRSPDGMNEHDFTYPTAEYVVQYLNEYESVEILRVYAKDRDVPLAERTSKANSWGANLYISIHGNAYGSDWNDAHGIETLVYSASTSSSNGFNVASRVHAALIREAGLFSRGIKVRPDLWEMRSTKMPSFLCECGFYTNRTEKALMATAAFQQKCARGIVNGVAAYYGLKKKVVAPPPIIETPINKEPAKRIYRVQIGAFSSKANAQRLEQQAEAKGFRDAFVTLDGRLYKVQLGAYSNYDNAKRQLDLAKSRGFKDAFLS